MVWLGSQERIGVQIYLGEEGGSVLFISAQKGGEQLCRAAEMCEPHF